MISQAPVAGQIELDTKIPTSPFCSYATLGTTLSDGCGDLSVARSSGDDPRIDGRLLAWSLVMISVRDRYT